MSFHSLSISHLSPVSPLSVRLFLYVLLPVFVFFAQVPLDADSVDCAVFSLSLMGTGFLDCIAEAHRVLRAKCVVVVCLFCLVGWLVCLLFGCLCCCCLAVVVVVFVCV